MVRHRSTGGGAARIIAYNIEKNNIKCEIARIGPSHNHQPLVARNDPCAGKYRQSLYGGSAVIAGGGHDAILK